MKNSFNTDVLIIGAGASGIAAAVAAIKAGASVTVVEKLSYPGGRATASAVGTICGLFLRGKKEEFVMKGFPKEFALSIMKKSKKEALRFSENLWFIPCPPEYFRSTAEDYLANEKINILYNSVVKSISHTNNSIENVDIQTQKEEFSFAAKSLIDCSGTGVSLNLLEHPMILDKNNQAAAIVFQVDGILAENEFTLQHLLIKYILQGIQQGAIPEHYNLLSIIPASLNKGSAQFKLGIPWIPEKESIELTSHTHKFISELFAFLCSGMPVFKNAHVSWIADEVGIRTGQRPQGKEILSETDILTCKKSKNEICKGSWPIEFWEIGNKKVSMTYFPENDYYSIPASCLVSNSFTNLFFAGKLISASEKAIASARVIGTCLGTGYAAGVLAAYKALGNSESEAISFIQSQMLS